MKNHSDDSRLAAITAQLREEATRALEDLLAVLREAGIVLPSLGLDAVSGFTGTVLIELGRARPDVIAAITALLRDGLNARAQQQS
ncbi:hypothetical protein [Kitasatospora mediocidica]|uniref:hypothetical protein n=1 Tax=Kitasatospora mediocidica TaxID=58352 RepID=UPI00068F46C2|nr:hypothetical protein [Kitasatospora mediocidica]